MEECFVAVILHYFDVHRRCRCTAENHEPHLDRVALVMMAMCRKQTCKISLRDVKRWCDVQVVRRDGSHGNVEHLLVEIPTSFARLTDLHDIGFSFDDEDML